MITLHGTYPVYDFISLVDDVQQATFEGLQPLPFSVHHCRLLGCFVAVVQRDRVRYSRVSHSSEPQRSNTRLT